MTVRDYSEFLASKALSDPATGIVEPGELRAHLFEHQRDIVRWALRRGRAAIFADCGLGKTPMQLEWADRVAHFTGGPVLILTPLAVAQQTVREGEKFGIAAAYAHDQSEATRITVTNYDRLERFDVEQFAGVVLDESSILKAFDGATRTALIEAFQRTPFRLACTATPAPNDFMELGNHSEFLSVLTRAEMLATFFVHDGGETQKWRLKGHAEHDFWKWLCSWAVMLRAPSDLGYSDDGFVLPPCLIQQHTVASPPSEGALFAIEAQTLQERLAARRASIDERIDEAAAVVNRTPGHWVVWCNLNAESDGLAKAIPGAVEVTGSMDADEKINRLRWFSGEICLCQCQKHASNTTANGHDRIANTSELTRESERTNETRGGESCTPPKKAGVSGNGETSGNGKSRIRTSALLSDLDRSGSPLTTTVLFSHHKTGDAPSAAPTTQETGAVIDSTSTIATQPDACAGSSAHRATSDSASSATTPTDSIAQPCMCGRISGRRVLVSKSSIAGFGMNWQHCHQMAFVGLSDSWEQYYQAVRRCWRFGQTEPVRVHVITAETEGAVVSNIKRKDADAARLAANMVEHMKDLSAALVHEGRTREQDVYATDVEESDRWTLHLGDCVDVLRTMPDASVHYSIFSPPFASLYTYSASDRDMGNVRDHEEFYKHFAFAVAELRRVLMPGRLVSFHCMNLPTLKSRDGVIGIRDFRGDLIRLFEAHDFILHSECVIWKDPVTQMQRTKSLGLLHKTIRTDSSMSRQGIPDYLITMRVPGDNEEPIPHTHEEFPVALWQRYASPVWMDINPSDTLQYRSAREHEDERHICPLQLDVIRRALKLWSNPNDVVLSPFAGIGSEGVVALEEGRRFVGVELKGSYFRQARANLASAVTAAADLFAEGA